MDALQLDALIHSMYDKNYSIREIVTTLHVGRPRICEVIQAFEKNSKIEHKRGRNVKVTSDIVRRIGDISFSDPSFSDLKVSNIISDEFDIKISRSEVNIVRHRINLFYKPRKICQEISEDQRTQRIQFAVDFFKGFFTRYKFNIF